MIGNMFELIVNIYVAFIMVFFLEKYLVLKRQMKTLYLLTGTIAMTILICVMNFYFYYEGLLGTCSYIILLMLLSFVFLVGNKKEKLYYPLLIISEYSMVSLCIAKIAALFADKSIKGVYLGYGWERIAVVMLVQIIYTLFMYLVYKIQFKHRSKLNSAELYIVILILILTNIIYFVINEIDIYFTQNNEVEALMALVIFSMLVINIAIYYLINQISMLYGRALENLKLKQETEAYEKSTKEIYKKYDEFKKIKHDIHNSYCIIQELAKNGMQKELEEYLQKQGTKIERYNNIVHTGSVYIDSLLNAKISEIKLSKINFFYKIEVIDFSGLEELDVCTILGNLLDNAKEACENLNEDLREIELIIKGDTSVIIICVINSVNYLDSKFNSIQETSKKDKEMHGVGIKIIKEVARKYGGIYNCKIIDNKFQANVMLFRND